MDNNQSDRTMNSWTGYSGPTACTCRCFPDAVIFDVDGTLWDSTESVAESWNQAIEAYGGLDLRLNREILKGLFGKTMDVICRELFPFLNGGERETLAELCFQYENELLKRKPGTFYPGVADTFRILSPRLPLFIVSNCQRGYIEVMLETGGLESYVKGHLCFGETGLPKSGTMLRLMKRYGLRQPVYVGDTQGDFEACQEAGLPFIFAAYGFGNAPGADYVIHSIGELPALLDTLSGRR